MSNSPNKSPVVCAHAKKHVYRFKAQSLTEQNMESSEVPTCQQCMDCGAVLMNEYEGVGPKKGPSGVPTMLMVESMFADQNVFERSFFDGEAILETIKPEDLADNPIALVYAAKREELINNLLRLGRKFKQRDRTVHVAATLMDNFFNNKRSQSLEQLRVLSNRCLYVFCTTFFLIASKFDEIDDRLVFIKDAQEYYQSININRCMNGGGPQNLIPSYSDIVECERLVMKFYDWNINFAVMGPVMFAEAFISMGILAKSSNNGENLVGPKALGLLNNLLELRVSLQNVVQMTESHKVAAYVIFKARKAVLEKGGDLGDVWPVEMTLITRVSQAEIEAFSRKLTSVQREVERLLSSEQGRTIIQKATEIKREPEAERPIDPSIKAALEAAKAGTFRKKKLPTVKLPMSNQQASKPEEAKSEVKEANAAPVVQSPIEKAVEQSNRDLRKIVAECRAMAQQNSLRQVKKTTAKMSALQLPPLEHVNLMSQTNSDKPQPAFVSMTSRNAKGMRDGTNQMPNFFNSARLSQGPPGSQANRRSPRMYQQRLGTGSKQQPKQRLIAQPSQQRGLAMPESARYGLSSKEKSIKRSVENIVKSAKRRAIQKFSPRDSMKSNSALGSIRSTDSLKGVIKTRKSCEKIGSITSKTKTSGQSSITKMTFLKSRASQEKNVHVSKIPRVKEAKSSESQPSMALKKKSMRPRVFQMKSDQRQIESIKLSAVCAKLQQQRPMHAAQKENLLRDNSKTESTSVDIRGSRVTSDPASFDRFAEIVTERAQGKIPKIDLTQCSGQQRPIVGGKFGLHTQRLSVGANLIGANLPKMLNHLDMDSDMLRRKNASHDKKAWWSKPTTLTKHLPDAFRTSQVPVVSNSGLVKTLVSNASRQSLARMHRRGRGFGSQIDGTKSLIQTTSGPDSNQPTSVYYQLGRNSREKSGQGRLIQSKSQTQRLISATGSTQEKSSVAPTFIK